MTGEAGQEALFVLDGRHVVPCEQARGPWTAEALHGGPVAALVTRAAEACEADPAMQLVRLTLELQRPVPVAPLVLDAVVSRPGRKVQVVDVSLSSDGTEVVRARAVRIRAHEPGAPAGEGLSAMADDGPVPGTDVAAPAAPDAGAASPMPPIPIGDYRAFHNSGAELRFVAGRFDTRGPASVWVRLAVPVVAGETPSPAQRATAAADFGNGVSSELDFTRYSFINPDLTVSLWRPPAGEWICLEASTHLGTPGVGMAESMLWDERGRVGRSLQSLVVERRP